MLNKTSLTKDNKKYWAHRKIKKMIKHKIDKNVDTTKSVGIPFNFYNIALHASPSILDR